MCIIHEDVPDLAPFYEAAKVVIAPIRLGSGTRLKILESLAYGKATVATSIAIEGIDLRPGVDIAVADDPDTFARVCGDLLDDARARSALGKTGRERVMEKYRWEAIVKSAEQLLLT
jgi:glycosyltransferase involved in cell wall biosynthesis